MTSEKISAIQEEFNSVFPYLKIEFFSKPDKSGAAHSKKLVKYGGKTLGECRTIHKNGHITITPQMTVTDLEEGFSNVYGLGTQVLRKSGQGWLETTVIDSWTLEKQNEQGEALSNLEKHIK